MSLPLPDEDALQHSQRLSEAIAAEIRKHDGWISFADYMAHVLYMPGLGYYSAGAQKFGAAGDFVTAPGLSGLFGEALAVQLAQIMAASAPVILEVGAGTGRLAADLLASLGARNALPDRYLILDLSGDLRARQRETIAAALPELIDRVEWLDRLPEQFSGAVVANELLDAMPAHLVVWAEAGAIEMGVALGADGQIERAGRPASGEVLQAAQEIAAECALPDGYLIEIGLAARRWSAEWGRRLVQGALVLIDYGFPRHEFYHPHRGEGTLMCHYRHHAHPDPFYLPGLQDVTVHVDFTAMIAAAHPAGLDLLGYTNQGQFLINCGILDLLAGIAQDTPDYVRAAGAVGKLVMPHEMGELFKVIAIGRGVDIPLCGFSSGDRSHRL